MQPSTYNPAPPTPNNGGSRLRTVVGNRYPRKCASCHETIPVGDAVRTVVDFGAAKPYPAYHAEHSPDAGSFRGHAPRNQESAPSGAGFQPASALPATPPAPPAPPAPPKAPVPTPLALLGAAGASEPSPSASAGAAWATSQLTFNAGPYESVKSGFADYCRPGESEAQLRERVNAVVLADVEFHVRAIRDLHARLGVPGQTFARTSSPAASAGAPQGALATPPSPPRMIVPPVSPAVEGASPGSRPPEAGAGPGPNTAPAQTESDGRPLKDLVKEVRLDLSDADPLRLSRKMRVWCDWLGKRGYTSASDVRRGDEWGLGRVLDEFATINRKG